MLLSKMYEEVCKTQPKAIKAEITEYNGGKYGRSGQYIAIVKPQYFKNGNLKKTDFTVVEKIEEIKKGYGYGSATHTEAITDILEIL